MYTADHADIDPNNPANQDEVVYTRFYISPNEIDEEVTVPDVVYDNEGEARDAAFAIARQIMKPVRYERGYEAMGGAPVYDDFELVKPEVRVA